MRYTIGLNTIEMYDSVHNMPILRLRRWNKYAMQSADVGSEFSDFANRLNKIQQFIHKQMNDSAIKEVENLRMSLYNGFTEQSPQLKSFALFVKNINGKVYDDISPSGIEDCLQHLDKIGLTNKQALDKLREVKKKSNWNYLFTLRNIFQRIGNKLR